MPGEAHRMTKFARPLIVALALLALGASLAALYVHYRIIKDPTYTSFCDINESVSCEAVLFTSSGVCLVRWRRCVGMVLYP